MQNQPTNPLSPKLLHDLRTPLNQILGYSDLLAEQATEEGHPQYIADLDKINTAGKRLLELLNEGPASTAPPVAVVDEASQSILPSNDAICHGVILVVDDDKMNRDVLSRRLAGYGYSTLLAESGLQALEVARRDRFDLILLDIMMPEMDGFEVLRTLKADESLRHIPVVMISALDELQSIVRCIELGAEDYLLKPFQPTLLKARIAASLTEKRARDREVELHAKLEASHERLQELEQLRDDVTNMIIHDLRTPLAALISGMRTLEMMGGLDTGQQEIVDIATNGGDALMLMINDLLDVEKIESGSFALDYALLDGSTLMDGAIRQVGPLATDRNLKIVRESTRDMPPMQGDEEKLNRVLVNLLANAIKFTPSGGTVTAAVRPSEDGGALRFSVRDTGLGIPKAAFGRIFEKFGQVEGRNGHVPGTGLGLTFCKLVTEAHGGQIRVESTPGAGSTFSITIPLTAVGDPVLA